MGKPPSPLRQSPSRRKMSSSPPQHQQQQPEKAKAKKRTHNTDSMSANQRLVEYFCIVSSQPRVWKGTCSADETAAENGTDGATTKRRRGLRRRRRDDASAISPPTISNLETENMDSSHSHRTEGNIHMPTTADGQSTAEHDVFQPQITARYPLEDYHDNPLNPMILQFCCPSIQNDTIWPTLQYEMPKIHHFVLTNDRGTKIYGTCLTIFEEYNNGNDNSNDDVDDSKKNQRVRSRAIHTHSQHHGDVEVCNLEDCPHPRNQQLYLPKVLCLLSTWPYLSAFRQYLAQLYRLTTATNVMACPLERYIVNLCCEIPAPPPGAYQVHVKLYDTTIHFGAPPAKLPIAYVALPYQILFDCLSIDHILTIWSALLVERKILFISSQHSILTVCAEIFLSLMFPLKWSHLYVPLLPRMLCPMLDAPVPYLIGICRQDWAHAEQCVSDETMVCDLDHNRILYAPNMPPVPKLPAKKFSKLQDGLYESVGHVFYRARNLQAEYQQTTVKNSNNKKAKKNQTLAQLETKASSSVCWKETLSGLDDAFSLAYRPDSSILDNDNNANNDVRWDQVQELFLRFFVALLKDYKKFLVMPNAENNNGFGNPLFDHKGFLAAQKAENTEFLSEFCASQQFDDLVGRRIYHAGEPDLLFFDSKIGEKLNRSRLQWKKSATFMQSALAHKVLQVIEALPPNDQSLLLHQTQQQPYVYPTWPQALDESLLITPRPIPRMISAEFDRQEMLVQRMAEANGGVTPPVVNDVDDLMGDYYFDPTPEVAAFTVFFFCYCAFVGQDWQAFDQKRRSLEQVAAGNSRQQQSPATEFQEAVEAVLPDSSSSKSLSFDPSAADGCLSDLSLGLCNACPEGGKTALNKTILFFQSPGENFSFLMQHTADQVADLQRQVTSIGSNIGVTNSSAEEFRNELEEAEEVAMAQLDLAFEAVAAVGLRKLSMDSDAYKSLMEACGRCGDTERALALMELMKRDGFVADNEILACFVAAFAHEGVVGGPPPKKGKPDAYSKYLEKQYKQASYEKESPISSMFVPDACRPFDERSTGSTECSDASSSRKSSFLGGWFQTPTDDNSVASNNQKKRKKKNKKRRHSSFQDMLVTDAMSNQLKLASSLLEFLYPDLNMDTNFDSCPRCSFNLSEDDVVNGWIPAAFADYTTLCPSCHHRFVPRFSISCSNPDFEGSQGLGTPLYCEFLSPWVLRKALHNIIRGDLGIRGMLDPKWRAGTDICATLFWNYVVICRRYRLPYSFLLQGSFQNRLILPRTPGHDV